MFNLKQVETFNKQSIISCMRRTSSEKAQKAIDYILFGLVVNYPRPFIISRQNAKIRSLGLSYPIFLRVLDKLTTIEIIKVDPGHYYKIRPDDRRGRSGCSIVAGRKFNKQAAISQISSDNLFRRKFPNCKETVESGRIKISVDTFDPFIDRLNEFNRKHDFVAGGKVLNTESYRLKRSGENLRIYSRYGYQFLKKGLRRNLTIDDSLTSEIDIQNCHLKLLHTILRENGKVPSVSNFDIEDYRFTRDQIKKAFHICLNTENERKATFTIHKKLGFSYKRSKELVSFTSEYFSEYKEFFFKEIWVILQQREAEVCDKVLENCMNLDIPVLPIYDSFVVPKEHTEEVVKHLESMGFEVSVV